MSSIPYTSDASFTADVLDSPVPVVVDVTADWCRPCRAMAPVLDQVADERGDFRIVKVDADRDPGLVSRLGVQGFPTFLVFRGGEVAGRIVGALPKRRFLEAVDHVLVGSMA